MKIISRLLNLPSYLQLITSLIESDAGQVTLIVMSNQLPVKCPVCQTVSTQVHSHYERTLGDLNLGEYRVVWKLWVRKFFCSRQDCPRKIFCERFSQLIEPWARRITRLTKQLTDIGLAVGGQLGVRLSKHLNYQTSRNSLIRLVMGLKLPEPDTVEQLGVDDFAWRKGVCYGTVLVDLEKNQPVTLLQNREAQTVSEWLQTHPGAKLLSQLYRDGWPTGARSPKARSLRDRRIGRSQYPNRATLSQISQLSCQAQTQ